MVIMKNLKIDLTFNGNKKLSPIDNHFLIANYFSLFHPLVVVYINHFPKLVAPFFGIN